LFQLDARDARIAELEQRLAAVAGCMSASDMHAEFRPPSESPSPERQAPSRVHVADAYAPSGDASKATENGSVLNQGAASCEDVTSQQDGGYGETADSSVTQPSTAENMNQPAEKRAACPMNVAEPEERRPRWSDEYRQEALDYHCQIHDLPPADVRQASGIPDPKSMSPKLAIQRGYPYLIYIDRTQERRRAFERLEERRKWQEREENW